MVREEIWNVPSLKKNFQWVNCTRQNCLLANSCTSKNSQQEDNYSAGKSRTVWQGDAILQLVVSPEYVCRLLRRLKSLLPVLAKWKSCSSPCWQQARMLTDQLHFCLENNCSSTRHFLCSAPAWELYPYKNKSRSSWNDITTLSHCLWQIFPHTKPLQILSPLI